MKLTSLWTAFRLPITIAVIGAIFIATALLGYLTGQPAEYEARFTLVAAPERKVPESDVDFGTIVAYTLPSLAEVSHSEPFLRQVAARAGSTIDADELSQNIRVELPPASGVARITVRGSDAPTVSALAYELAKALQNLDLLSFVGNFRLLPDKLPIAVQVAPDWRFATGVALAAGCLGGILLGALATVASPRVVTSRSARAALRDSSTPVLHVGPEEEEYRKTWELLGSAADAVVPAGKSAEAAAQFVRRNTGSKLAFGEVASLSDRASPDESAQVVLAVASGRTTPQEVANSKAMLDVAGARLLAVVLVSDSAGPPPAEANSVTFLERSLSAEKADATD